MPVGFAASICVWEAFVFMYYEVKVCPVFQPMELSYALR